MAGAVYAKHILQVTNIPWTVSRHELALYFSRFGHVQDSFVSFDKQTGIHQRYGNITFLKTNHVSKVLSQKHTLEGKKLSVSVRARKFEQD